MTLCHKLVPAAGLALLLASPVALADSVTITTSKDNTLYEDGTGSLSNGAGPYFYAGKAGSLRRGLLHFDVAASVPAGSTIQGVALTLYCSRAPYGGPPLSPPVVVNLHRALADWGEGTSDAGDPGGTGTAATPGDATWIHTFFNSSVWTNAGGDFLAASSGSQTCGGVGSYSWSSAQMAADVQAWLDNPGTNFGWVVVGHEPDAINARRFDTKENATAVNRPALAIVYETGPVAIQPSAWSAVKALYLD